MTQKKQTEYFEVKVKFCFDPEYIDCKHCPLLETYSREVCRLTGEFITNNKCVGNWCPFLDEVIDFQLNYELKKLNQNK